MPNKKITQLPVAADVQDGDLIEKVTVASGVSEQATIHKLARALGIFINGVNAGIPNIIVYPDGSIDFVGSQVQISVAGILTAPFGITAAAGTVVIDVGGTIQTQGNIANDGCSINENGSASFGNLNIDTAGNILLSLGAYLRFFPGANQRAGNLTLVGGTKTIANTTVTANTVVLLTRKTTGGTIGFAVTYTLNAGVSFTVTSDNALDTSTYSYLLIEVV